ncbi:MAG: RNA polymerase Rpb4 family protein [Candidatus Omnitrophica bacterium]|nr:RNA polymerase Rpb4 family protein [Candidatus Omnitrophota bacterium]
MIGKKILDVREVTLAEVKEILEMPSEIEMGFEQAKTLEYAKKMTKLNKEEAEEMVNELMGEIAKLNRAKAVKIVDLMPKKKEELDQIFAKETYSLTEEEINKILEIVAKRSKA